jgi:hypothetical protein
MADIYTKIEGDPGFERNRIETTEELDYLLTQIEVILFTRSGDVLGDPGLGADLDNLIFSTNLSASSIEAVVMNQINNYSRLLANKYLVDARCNFYKQTDRDVGVLDITINGAVAVGLVFA